MTQPERGDKPCLPACGWEAGGWRAWQPIWGTSALHWPSAELGCLRPEVELCFSTASEKSAGFFSETILASHFSGTLNFGEHLNMVKSSVIWLELTPVSEKAMAPHCSTLAWKIPWMEEPGGLQSMESLSQIRLSDFTLTFCFHALEKEMATHSSVLAWRVPGMGEPGGLTSMGSHRVGHD